MSTPAKSPRQTLAQRLERSRRHRQWLGKESSSVEGSSVGGGSLIPIGLTASKPLSNLTSPSAQTQSTSAKPLSGNPAASFDIGPSDVGPTMATPEKNETLIPHRQRAPQVGHQRAANGLNSSTGSEPRQPPSPSAEGLQEASASPFSAQEKTVNEFDSKNDTPNQTQIENLSGQEGKPSRPKVPQSPRERYQAALVETSVEGCSNKTDQVALPKNRYIATKGAIDEKPVSSWKYKSSNAGGQLGQDKSWKSRSLCDAGAYVSKEASNESPRGISQSVEETDHEQKPEHFSSAYGATIETPKKVSVASLRASFNARGSNRPIMPMNSKDPRMRQSLPPSTTPTKNGDTSDSKPRKSWQKAASTLGAYDQSRPSWTKRNTQDIDISQKAGKQVSAASESQNEEAKSEARAVVVSPVDFDSSGVSRVHTTQKESVRHSVPRPHQKRFSKAPWQQDSTANKESNENKAVASWRKTRNSVSSSTPEDTPGINLTSSLTLQENPNDKEKTLGPFVLPQKSKTPPLSSKGNVTIEAMGPVILPTLQKKESKTKQDQPEERCYQPDLPPERINRGDHVEEKKSNDDTLVLDEETALALYGETKVSDEDCTEGIPPKKSNETIPSQMEADQMDRFFEDLTRNTSMPASSDEDNDSHLSKTVESSSASPIFASSISHDSADAFVREARMQTYSPRDDKNRDISPSRISIKQSDSTSVYIEDEKNRDSSPLRISIKQSDSTSVYIEDETLPPRGTHLDEDQIHCDNRIEVANDQTVSKGSQNQMKPDTNSRYPRLTPSPRDNDAYRKGYFGDSPPTSHRSKSRNNSTPKHAIEKNNSMDVRESTSSGKDFLEEETPRQQSRSSEYVDSPGYDESSRDTSSRGSQSEVDNFVADQWLDKDPDLEGFGDDDSFPGHENKGSNLLVTSSQADSSRAHGRLQVHTRSELSQQINRQSGHGYMDTHKMNEKKSRKEDVFDPFAQDDDLRIENSENLFSPSQDAFMSEESFSPLDWGTPQGNQFFSEENVTSSKNGFEI